MGDKNKNRITVFEHQALKLSDNDEFKKHHLEALQRYYGERGTNYFSLINNGVKFNQYVGVLQVGKLVIEVLPKTDKSENIDWRKLLISMLRVVGTVKVFNAGTTNLKLRSNSILDLYFELFITEVELLIHQGLIKQYRRDEGNRSSLKGKLHFPKQLQHNIIHKERFFVNHQTYDWENIHNQILLAALKVIQTINTSSALQSRIESLLMAFPELSSIKVTENTFNRLTFSRKTEPYREALNIARLILLNYHPDLSKGQNNVLALLFDMNVLWERFILKSLKEYAPKDIRVKGKIRKPFWKPEIGNRAFIEPDIVIEHGEATYVLDTKWKVLKDNRPSDDDLKQMYVYSKYYNSSYTALVYPGNGMDSCPGKFCPEFKEAPEFSCSLIRIDIPDANVRKWQNELSMKLIGSINS
ncbi:McrC family protein [Draconibacterium sediminis]|uniref:Restriction endonuclease n=1 Tax=Draconibacterium sediminis TaxID=1544798 RepID=A0A0D8JCM0_9BACT|nr:hypothetical protein [Draconibacterium sediminis]KJF44261.1 hypothetical protein LH29_01720 [Draconibacterium sediminis]